MTAVSERRSRLSGLADRLFLYYEKVHDSGFSCGHIRWDWINENFDSIDIELHQKFLVEFAREALSTGSTAEVIYSDSYVCNSAFLDELKRERLIKYGSAESLLERSNTRHLIELSPCERELSRLAEQSDSQSVETMSFLSQEFEKRRRSELEIHADLIDKLIENLPVELSESCLQSFYADAVYESLGIGGGERVRAPGMFGSVKNIFFELDGGALLLLDPIVSTNVDGKDISLEDFGGSVGLGFALTTRDSILAEKYVNSEFFNLNISELLPGGFRNYRRFDCAREMCLNMLAHIRSLQVILPDALALLHKGGVAK